VIDSASVVHIYSRASTETPTHTHTRQKIKINPLPNLTFCVVTLRPHSTGSLLCQDHSPATKQRVVTLATTHTHPFKATAKNTEAQLDAAHKSKQHHVFMMLKQVYPVEGLRGAKCVQRLDDSQIVQIALRFAFHCVLHRCKSPEIRC
jgi:hypothetical protein